jgi:hypothetical protein
LENKKAEQVLPGIKGVGGGERGRKVEGQGGEIGQTMYMHMNKYKNNKKRKPKHRIEIFLISYLSSSYLSTSLSFSKTSFQCSRINYGEMGGKRETFFYSSQRKWE